MRILPLLCLAVISPLVAAAPFDAARLQTGRFVYQDMKDGKQIATFALTVRKRPDGNYIFTGDADGFNQHWAAVATADFTPLTSELRLQRASGKIYSMSLSYASGQVTGTEVESTEATNHLPGAVGSSKKITPATIKANTVDQRIDWAAMLSTRLEIGDEVNFFVYDPGTGLTAVNGRCLGRKTITVPVGTYDGLRLRYRMDKVAGAETYEIQITSGTPRMMIREEFPNGLVTELIAAKFE